MRLLTVMALIVAVPGLALGQPGSNRPAFDIADVHVSPRTDWVKNFAHGMQGGFLAGDRYELHRATMLDLIKTAYNVDADKIYGGPSWLDYDRFEIAAKTKPGTRPATLRLMLQTLLADRFHVVVKKDTQPVAGYVLSTGKSELKLKAATDGSGSNGCQRAMRLNAGVMTTAFQCRDMTMDEFAFFLHGPVSLPVLNSTGLDGAWDMDFQYAIGRLAAGGTQAAGVIDAVAGLGLKLEQGKVPQPVLTVETANEQPSANPPGVAEALPPLRTPEFEVATIRICNPNDSGGSRSPQFEPGGRVTANCMPPNGLISEAWNLAPFQYPVGEPKSFQGSSIALNVSIVAKAPEGTSPDRDTLNAMMRALLTDRYKMVVHYEDRAVDAYTLVGTKPKLTKADPANRTGCTRQNQQREDGLRLTRLVCQNMTMTQFAEQIQAYDSDIFYLVLDGTGIEGAWDFAIDYDAMANLIARFFPGRSGAAAPDGQAPDPTGTLAFADAIQKQLGLKLEVHKRPEPVLVIDHMEEKPTEN
jgi:uncharacterized protein (TIGR03435 family)